jgi:hypothetical protein
MKRLIGTLFVTLAIFLGACASSPDLNRERLESLPQHYAQFDVALAWQVTSAGSQTSISGELKSLRYQYMEDLEVWVALLDAAGKPVARSVSYVIPQQVKIGEIVPFSLTLPVPAPPGSRLRFTYNYTGSDGGDDKGGYRTQSFEALVPAR